MLRYLLFKVRNFVAEGAEIGLLCVYILVFSLILNDILHIKIFLTPRFLHFNFDNGLYFHFFKAPLAPGIGLRTELDVVAAEITTRTLEILDSLVMTARANSLFVGIDSSASPYRLII